MAAAAILINHNQKIAISRRYSVTMRTVQSWTCKLGHGADIMFHRTYFLLLLMVYLKSPTTWKCACWFTYLSYKLRKSLWFRCLIWDTVSRSELVRPCQLPSLPTTTKHVCISFMIGDDTGNNMNKGKVIYWICVITSAASIASDVTMWRPSICPSVCLSRRHTNRDLQGGNMRRGQRTFRPDNENRHTCFQHTYYPLIVTTLELSIVK